MDPDMCLTLSAFLSRRRPRMGSGTIYRQWENMFGVLGLRPILSLRLWPWLAGLKLSRISWHPRCELGALLRGCVRVIILIATLTPSPHTRRGSIRTRPLTQNHKPRSNSHGQHPEVTLLNIPLGAQNDSTPFDLPTYNFNNKGEMVAINLCEQHATCNDTRLLK